MGLFRQAPEDVGAEDTTLRLWRAREAMRQGEASLVAQSTALDGLRSQATSLLGWSVAIGTALAVAAITKQMPHLALAVVITDAITAALCTGTLWVTTAWKGAYNDPLTIMDHPEKSEMEITEAIAQGADSAIKRNERTLRSRAALLRAAWISFSLIPVVGLLAYLKG